MPLGIKVYTTILNIQVLGVVLLQFFANAIYILKFSTNQLRPIIDNNFMIHTWLEVNTKTID